MFNSLVRRRAVALLLPLSALMTGALCAPSEPLPCVGEPDPAALGVEEGVVGNFTFSYLSSDCVDMTLRHLPVTEAPADDAAATAVYEANVDSIEVTATDGVYGQTLTPGPWLICTVGEQDDHCLFHDLAPGSVLWITAHYNDVPGPLQAGRAEDDVTYLDVDDPDEG